MMFLFTSTVTAGVYRWVDDQGQVHFSDQPSQGAKQVELRETSVYTPPADQQLESNVSRGGEESEGADPEFSYSSIAIVAPEADEPIRSNAGQVDISVELQPGLQPGHLIRVFLDDTQAAEDLDTTQISLQDVDRGTHKLSVAVIDPEGRELKRSDTINFHVLRVAAPRAQPFGGGG